MARTSGVIGAAEIEAVLKQLPDRIAKTVVKAGLRAGATVIVRAAKAKVRANSRDTGALESKIGARTAKPGGKGAVRVQVGVRGGVVVATPKGRKTPRRIVPARTAHLVEFGSKDMPAEPFLRPALDESGDAAVKRIGESMGRGVEREARALASGRKSFVTGRKL